MAEEYSVPTEAKKILQELVKDSRLQTPPEVVEAAVKVTITGTDAPILPIPWKFGDAIGALKGLEGAWGSTIAASRYGGKPESVSLNTDGSTLFVFAAFLATLNGVGGRDPSVQGLMKNWDLHDSLNVRYRQLASTIYETKDHKFFHLHGSQTMIGIATHRPDLTDPAEIAPIYKEAVAKFTAAEIDTLANDKFKQAGTICYTVEEFRQTEQGKAIANSPIYELTEVPTSNPSTPCPWPEASSDSLPLSGIKVLDLSRIIAAPAISRSLAELGATVLRITSPNLADAHTLHFDLSQGKYQAHLDLKSEEGKAKLQELIADCDVIVDGYRPGAMDRRGFGREAVLELVKDRPNGRGIVYVRENCYGWHGPWAIRAGWQQISDCLTGVSWGFGLAQGLNEPAVPIFPNSDYGTGAIGGIGAMHALYLRSQKGGSYFVDVSLSYYNTWLISLGQYSKEVFAKAYAPFASNPVRHWNDMVASLGFTIPKIFSEYKHLSDPALWTKVWAPSYNGEIRTVAPVVKYEKMKTGYCRPAYQNGSDPAEWPKVA